MLLNRRNAMRIAARFVSLLMGYSAGAVVAGPSQARAGTSVNDVEDLRSRESSFGSDTVTMLAWSSGTATGGGSFAIDALDRESPDNGGTIIVDKGGNRWKRVLSDERSITPHMFGALGDGLADDTRSIQSALDWVVANGGRLFFPSGRYRITSPLSIGSEVGATKSGFAVEGVSRSTPRWNGSLIWLDAVEAAAILIWKKTAWRNAKLANLGLACSRVDGAEIGLLIDSSEISDIHFDELAIEGVTTAIALRQGTGRNGEFCSFTNIWTWNVRNFFHSNAGQAFGIDINHVFCYHRGGGELFRMDPQVVGGGLIVRAFSATPTDPEKRKSVTNTTLLTLTGKHNAPILFEGGRLEHLTCVLRTSQFARDGVVNTPIKFIGTQFTMDSLEANAQNLMAGQIILEGTAPNLITFDTCQFSAFKAEGGSFLVKVDQAGRGTLVFSMCNFNGFSRLPTVDLSFNTLQEVHFRNCIGNAVATDGGRVAAGLPVKFDRRFGVTRSLLPLRASGANKDQATNLLSAPLFRKIAASAAEGYASPWQSIGAGPGPAVRKVLSPGHQDQSVVLVLSSKSGILQDILNFPLSRGNTVVDGVRLLSIRYTGFLARISGEMITRFALENSATGQVYDEVKLSGTGSGGPQEIELTALIQTTPIGRLRFKIENLGAGSAEFEFVDQLVSESVRSEPDVLSRRASDFDDPNAQRVARADRVPTSGSWSIGDIIYNSSPSAGGHVGWVCVRSGEPGEWKLFGAIESR